MVSGRRSVIRFDLQQLDEFDRLVHTAKENIN